jgi:Na+-driven multidrug efflux pump
MVLYGITRTTGAVMAPLLITTLSLLVVRFPLAAALLDTWHADAIWWSLSISAALEVGLAGMYYKFGGWRPAQAKISDPGEEAMGTDPTQRL